MRASQCAQGATQPQALQKRLGAYPRRFKNTMIWPPALQVLRHRLHRRRRQSLFGGVPAQIHQRHSRRLRRPGALRQQVFEVAPGRRIFQGFERWRRGAQDDGHRRTAGADHREIARRIAKSFVLLVRGVVLLVDDDERELGQRREYRGARSDDDPRLRRCAPPARRRGVQCRSSPNAAPPPRQLKRRRKRSTSCGVKAISGTSTRAWPPAAIAAAMTRKYTSVLPLPVTP